MPHVGIERLSTRDREHDCAKYHEAGESVREEELHAMPRIDREKNMWRFRDFPDAEYRNREKPNEYEAFVNCAIGECPATCTGCGDGVCDPVSGEYDDCPADCAP